jgi:predicted ATPase
VEVVERLRAACTRARAGRGGTALITGETGIGKTSVAETVAVIARADGTDVVFVPYETTAGLSKEIAPDRLTGDALAASAPTVLVLDDLHRADRASLHGLRQLAARVDRSQLLVIATVDDAAVGAARAVASVGGGSTMVLPLAGLTAAELAQMGYQLTGSSIPEATASMLAARTRGNPLLVSELLLHLRGSGLLDRAEAVAEALETWPGVEGVIAFRVAGLGIACRRLLVEAARMGASFSLRGLRAASGLDPETFIDVVDEAQAEAFLRPVPWDPDRYRFSHPLHRKIAGRV